MPKRKSKNAPSNFSSDRPIQSWRDDTLQRKNFASGLADRIKGWKGHDSLVLALCGEWGCGKTSLKNMVLEQLKGRSVAKIGLMEFNPWEFSGKDALTDIFFRELALVIEPSEDEPSADKATVQKLRRYAKLTNFGRGFLKVVSSTLGALGREEATVVDAMAESVGKVSDMATNAADAQESVNQQNQESLTDLKRSIAAGMRKLRKPVLIVIDDIDRLTDLEIREVFQLVKANADFPNLIYLLMFDREIVGRALDSVSGGRGGEFLEKIIQVLFDVPQPSLAKVHEIFHQGISDQLEAVGGTNKWDFNRWGNLWTFSLSGYFRNLRSVYRFLGSFSFQASLLKSGRSFNMNPVDLVTLETLRLFEPALHQALAAKKTFLTGGIFWEVHNRDKNQEERAEEEWDYLLKLVGESRRDKLRSVLRTLFPLSKPTQAHLRDELLRDLRVGCESNFDRYFTLSLGSDDVSQAEVEYLWEEIENPIKFTEFCKILCREGRLDMAFQRLHSYRNQLPIQFTSRAITSFCNVGDILNDGSNTNHFVAGHLELAANFVVDNLKQIEDVEVRFTMLMDGIRASSGVKLAAYIASRKVGTVESGNQDFFTDELQSVELKNLAFERLREASLNGYMQKLKGLSYTLYRWRDWAGIAEVKTNLTASLVTVDDALWLLRTFLGVTSISSLDGGRSKHEFIRRISINELSEFTDIERLETLTKSIELELLPLEERRALKAFRWALIWQAQGKPDRFVPEKNNPLSEPF